MKRHSQILLSMAIVVFLTHIRLAVCKDTPETLPVSVAVPDPVYDPMFYPQRRGFLGADGAASVSLGSKRILWIFGDTILGNMMDGKRRGTMVRNSIAIQDLSRGEPGEVTYYWDLSDRIPGDFIQFWSKGGEWLPKPDNLEPLYEPGTTESSLYYDPVRKRYFTAVIKPFSADFCIFTAEKLTGPWTKPQKIYHIPEIRRNRDYHAYASRIHPMLLDDPDVLVLSYVVNTYDFWSMFETPDLYYPRFIRLGLEPDNVKGE
jgi:hypothetical protein